MWVLGTVGWVAPDASRCRQLRMASRKTVQATYQNSTQNHVRATEWVVKTSCKSEDKSIAGAVFASRPEIQRIKIMTVASARTRRTISAVRRFVGGHRTHLKRVSARSASATATRISLAIRILPQTLSHRPLSLRFSSRYEIHTPDRRATGRVHVIVLERILP